VGQLKDIPEKSRAFMKGHDGANFGLPIKSSDLVAFKNDYSAYDQLIGYVKSNNISKIILSGLFEATQDSLRQGWGYQCCISATANAFRAAGLEVSIVAEGTNVGTKAKSLFKRNPHFRSLDERQELHKQWVIR